MGMENKQTKGKIVIIECISSSVNYIIDILNEGYEPILLEPYESNFFIRRYMRKFHDQEIRSLLPKDVAWPKIITEKSKYEETLQMIKGINPVLIIPGSDRGIELATKLSFDLGLVGNDLNNLEKMRDKYVAQQTLKDANLRYIRSALVENYDEAYEFFLKLKKDNKTMVVKPVSGISSIGVFVVRNEKELKKAIRYNNGFIGRLYKRNTNKILVQEFIDGVEYIFNTVSFNGVHKVTQISKYKKDLIDNRKVYCAEYLKDPNSKISKQLINYGLKVVDAIGIKYGATHLEIMLDENGPVLIEANCRLSGGHKSIRLQETTMGIHESKLSLFSYLQKNDYMKEDEVLYKTNKLFVVKYLFLRNNAFIRNICIDEVAKQMPGYFESIIHNKIGFYQKTKDLNSCLGLLFFVDEDLEVLNKNIEIITEIEKNHLNMLFNGIKL